MKKRIILSLALSFLYTTLYAQNRYCRSYADFLNNKWIPVDSLTNTTQTDSLRIWNLRGDHEPQTGNEEVDKRLEEEARFIQCHDNSLYINCRGLKYNKIKIGSWYAPGFRFEKDKICFISAKINLDKANNTSVYIPFGFVGGLVGGLIGGAIVGAIEGAIRGLEISPKHTDQYACYLIRSDDNKAFPITSQYMTYLLSSYPEILDEYEQLDETEMEAPEIILYFLNRLRVLNQY